MADYTTKLADYSRQIIAYSQKYITGWLRNITNKPKMIVVRTKKTGYKTFYPAVGKNKILASFRNVIYL